VVFQLNPHLAQFGMFWLCSLALAVHPAFGNGKQGGRLFYDVIQKPPIFIPTEMSPGTRFVVDPHQSNNAIFCLYHGTPVVQAQLFS
jgi:hypothetical protein